VSKSLLELEVGIRRISLFTYIIQAELEVVNPELASRYENYIRHQTGIIGDIEGLQYLAQVDKLRAEGKISSVKKIEQEVNELCLITDFEQLQQILDNYKDKFRQSKQ